ncbi:MAG: nuclear transport factor 2 family protein [Candidatus Dadabacteria bacterium]|nr:nuclear transport factor 2 family protein [Candidatus Dadabacteria bacterium]NIS07460.1 nuclear transport factor 2 family protein [Candidatus Dadabacteria bacterium]NIV42445.1 hypothetical protein [Candidatus Dadabacteria bacterium]NIY21104.1 hypothetical protein [Candidatus Dadabacteria bacterium]
MEIIDTFESFAEDFEATLEDDNWDRLKKYFAEDATYLNVGSPDPKSEGRDAILAFFKADVANNDRKFDTRSLTALTPPKVEGNRLTRHWRCTYTLAGTPDLVLEGEARYVFERELIKEIEQELTADSMQKYSEWMRKYGDKLEGS